MQINRLYNDDNLLKDALARIQTLKEIFIKNENCAPDAIFSSPGRAEILGNHTDHNHGKVIVGAISCDIIAACKKRDDNIIKICSTGYPDVIVDINSLDVRKDEYGTSGALARGVVAKLKQLGNNFNGFTAYTHSTIFKGAGVSSSAAFEVLVAETINAFYLEGKLSAMQKAQIAQYAENVYFNKPCGILDQSGIALGGCNKLDLKNIQSPEITALKIPQGLSLIITNTGGDHANLTEHYSAIRTEMHNVANFFSKEYLRDVDENEFSAALPELKKCVSGRAIMRAFHFYNENKRVDKAATALENGDIQNFLSLVNQSGDSSMTYLQNCFVPAETEQLIPLALAASKSFLKGGAVRIHGGGFAGTIIAFVENEQKNGYIQLMKNIFGAENVFDTSIRSYGTTRIE